MYRAYRVSYTIITISTTWYSNQSLSVSHTTGSSYRSPCSSRTHPNMATCNIIRTREWPNNRRSQCHYCLYSFIML